jgi:hypothetical protein
VGRKTSIRQPTLFNLEFPLHNLCLAIVFVL